jgi:pseudouridine-5'-phosphate glycosidase/pseudouridine kinase
MIQNIFYQTVSPAGKTYAATGGALEIGEINTAISGRPKVLVVGSAALDISAQTEDTAGSHSTSPGTVAISLGGVARNIAEACHRVGTPTLLIAGLGADAWGQLLYDETKVVGMRTDGFIKRSNERTAVCNLFLNGSGDLVNGVADMAITQKLDAYLVLQQIAKHSPEIVALDGNLSADTIGGIVDYCVERNIQRMSFVGSASPS